jgi:hypothetical protein
MKLSKVQMQYICEKVLRRLKELDLIKFRVDEKAVLQRMTAEFEKNLAEEAGIDSQVNKLLLQYQTEIANGSISKGKMFNMLKKKIAEERKFIL